MERNTKILLGVGAGVLAYLIYRASKTQSSNDNQNISESSDIPAGAYRLKEDISGAVVYGDKTIEYNFKAGDLVIARPMEVRKGSEKIIILKTTPDGKMPCEGFSCIGQVWVDIPLDKAEFSGRAIAHGGSGTSSSDVTPSSEPKSQADCPAGTTFSYQPTGDAKCPPGTPQELGCSPMRQYKPMCVKNIDPDESILKGTLNSFDGSVGSTFSEWDTPIQNYGYGSLGSGLGLQGI